MTAEEYGCEYLNDIVKQMTKDAYSKKDDGAPGIEFTTAQEINYKVYQERDNRVTYTLCVAAALLLYCTVHKMSYLELASATVISWCASDLYGGIVHIVLDHTDVIYYRIPDLWRPALEFQWHHWIPHDIVDKPVMYVLGDLNRAVTLNIVAMLISALFYSFDDPIYHYCFACKLLMAYAGQLSHRMAHSTSKERPWFARQLEFLVIEKVEHQKHHKDHGKNFSILAGLCNPLLNSVVDIIGLKTVWPYLAMLGLFTFLDCHFIGHKFVPAISSLFL